MVYDFEKSLKEIKTINWDERFRDVDISVFREIDKLYYSLFPLFLVPSQLYFKEQFRNNYYRVRPYEKIKNHHDFSEYSYPPKQFAQNQRANIKNNPVFYASIHPKTSVLEYVINRKNALKSDFLSLSVWSIDCNRDIRVVNLLNKKNTKEATRLLGINNTDSFKNYIKSKLHSDEARCYIKLHEYFINSFCKKNNHVFSSYIAHKCLYTIKPQTDILIYPSLAQNNSSINIVLNKNFADKYLNLKRVYTVKAIRKEIEKPVFYGNVLFFEENQLKKEMILDNSIAMTTITHMDFGDSVK